MAGAGGRSIFCGAFRPVADDCVGVPRSARRRGHGQFDDFRGRALSRESGAHGRVAPGSPSGAAVSRGEAQDLAGNPAAVDGRERTAAGTAAASQMAGAGIRESPEPAGPLAGGWHGPGRAGASDRAGGAFVADGAAVAALARAAGRRRDAVRPGDTASVPGLADRGLRAGASAPPVDVSEVTAEGSDGGAAARKRADEAENAAGGRSAGRDVEAARHGMGESCSLERADGGLRADYGDSGAEWANKFRRNHLSDSTALPELLVAVRAASSV